MWTSLRQVLARFDKHKRHQQKLLRPEYSYLYDTPMADKWVSIDCEMTGLNPKSDHILSVGAVHIHKVGQAWQIDSQNALSLICQPPIMPSDDNIIVHGLRPIDVACGISYDELLERLLPFVGNLPLVGFCVQMDKLFLDELVRPFLGVPLINECLDVSLMEQAAAQAQLGTYERVARRKHLNELLDDYQIPRLPAHDALNDALNAAMVFCCLQGQA